MRFHRQGRGWVLHAKGPKHALPQSFSIEAPVDIVVADDEQTQVEAVAASACSDTLHLANAGWHHVLCGSMLDAGRRRLRNQ